MQKNAIVPVIIPSLEPDERLCLLLQDLKEKNIAPIVLVDDGSSMQYRSIFDVAEKEYGCIVLRHAVNLGKGRALKDAFNFCLNKWENMLGCVTADSDGQHTVDCILRCIDALINNPHSLILGVRDFTLENIPNKSRMGNKITRQICKYLCGVNVSDTQTGLRAIPKAFMKELMSVEGERFEFETRMLVVTKDRYNIVEIPIETIYDSKEKHTTHFDPLKDSIRIYKIFGSIFAKYAFSSLSSSALDIVFYALFCNLLSYLIGSPLYAFIATILARVLSATYNYLLNYSVVFKSKASHKQSAKRYLILAILQMLCSAMLVAFGVWILGEQFNMIVKIIVDTTLFFISYIIQREIVYH